MWLSKAHQTPLEGRSEAAISVLLVIMSSSSTLPSNDMLACPLTMGSRCCESSCSFCHLLSQHHTHLWTSKSHSLVVVPLCAVPFTWSSFWVGAKHQWIEASHTHVLFQLLDPWPYSNFDLRPMTDQQLYMVRWMESLSKPCTPYTLHQ